MSATLLVIYTLMIGGLIASFTKNKQKTMQAFKIARKMFLKSLPSLLLIILIIGFTLALLPPETISKLIGEESGIGSTIIAGILGGITMIPSIIAFPLAGSLYDNGATITTVSVFITTLVMVGAMTSPLEIKILGKKFTILRNLLSFIAAFGIALIMGGILS